LPWRHEQYVNARLHFQRVQIIEIGNTRQQGVLQFLCGGDDTTRLYVGNPAHRRISRKSKPDISDITLTQINLRCTARSFHQNQVLLRRQYGMALQHTG
jgi:hypothetical protein